MSALAVVWLLSISAVLGLTSALIALVGRWYESQHRLVPWKTYYVSLGIVFVALGVGVVGLIGAILL